MFKTKIVLPLEAFSDPIEFTIYDYTLRIEEMIAKGGEGIIYRGTMDEKSVVFKMYIKSSRMLKYLPSALSKYCPEKYLLFQEGKQRFVIVMEPLRPSVYSKTLLEESLAFLSDLKALNEVHGDISPGNIMMDSEGHAKFIDFARSKAILGTPFYSKNHNDSESLALVLLGLKYGEWIRNYVEVVYKESKDDYLKQKLYLPLHKITLHTLFRSYQIKNKDATEDMFMVWLHDSLPEDGKKEKELLMRMYHSSMLLWNDTYKMDEIIRCAIFSDAIKETRSLYSEEIKTIFKEVALSFPGWKWAERCEPTLMNDHGTKQLRCYQKGGNLYSLATINHEVWNCLVLRDDHPYPSLRREEKIEFAKALKRALQKKLEYPIVVEVIQTITIE